MKPWRIAMAGLLLAATATSAASPDPQKFTAEMATRIAKAAPRVTVTIAGPLTLKVVGGPEGEAEINLDRIAAFCAENNAEDCEANKTRFIAGTVEMATVRYEVTRERLRVIVRSIEYAAAIQQTLGANRKLLVRPLGDGIVALIAADFPTTLSLVAKEDLEKLHLSESEAFDLGRRNVLARLPKLPSAADLKSRIIMFAGEDYDASLLLADGWEKLAQETHGRLFVTVTSDNQLVAGVADDGEQVRRLREIAADGFRTADRGVSPEVFRWSEKGWVVAK